MKNEQFEEWWATMEPGFRELQPVMMLAFKELAEKAWDNGFDCGWDACGDTLYWGNDG